MIFDIDEMTEGYIQVALWADCAGNCDCDCDCDCDCEPGGREHLDVLPDDRAYVRRLCALFVEQNRSDCEAYCERLGDWSGAADSLGRDSYSASERLGHDLRYTSSGHGTGFWDRGLGEVGERLASAASAPQWSVECLGG